MKIRSIFRDDSFAVYVDDVLEMCAENAFNVDKEMMVDICTAWFKDSGLPTKKSRRWHHRHDPEGYALFPDGTFSPPADYDRAVAYIFAGEGGEVRLGSFEEE